MSLVTEEVRVALDTERKFEFYLAGVIFTVLGFASQTVEPYAEPLRNACLLIALVLLVASSVCAILTLEFMVRRHWTIANMQGWSEALKVLQGEKAKGATHVNIQGESQPKLIDEQIKLVEENSNKDSAKSVTHRRFLRWLRNVRTWSFLVGSVLFLTAKVWPLFGA